MQNWVLEISDDITVTSFSNQSQENVVFCLSYQEASSYKI